MLCLSSCKKECYYCTVGAEHKTICKDDGRYTPISKGWKVEDATTGAEYICK